MIFLLRISSSLALANSHKYHVVYIIALGFESGMVIVVVAILLDRMLRMEGRK